MNEQLTLPQPKLSQKQKDLLALLQNGRRLSKQEILHELHVWNSGHLVWLLRKAGYPIQMEKVHRGETEYGVYFIPKAA